MRSGTQLSQFHGVLLPTFTLLSIGGVSIAYSRDCLIKEEIYFYNLNSFIYIYMSYRCIIYCMHAETEVYT